MSNEDVAAVPQCHIFIVVLCDYHNTVIDSPPLPSAGKRPHVICAIEHNPVLMLPGLM